MAIFFVGQYLADVAQEMRAVEGFDGDIDRELAGGVLVPVHVHDAFRVRFGEVLQVGASRCGGCLRLYPG